MRTRLLALIAGVVAAAASVGTAAANPPPPTVLSSQTAAQVATSGQQASSSATSTQINPTNTNVSVRVLSPGNNGTVSQSNSSTAAALGANANSTTQQTGQAGSILANAAQLAANHQGAAAQAASTQIEPENTNVSVRVLSPGNDGNVTQSNDSNATALAANLNETGQTVAQSGGGAQEAVQGAANGQWAGASAESKQVKPNNTNISVRVLSPGKNGSVSQSNRSNATALAVNKNAVDQETTQRAGYPAVQTGAQVAENKQSADAWAESIQVKPENLNVDARVLSPEHRTAEPAKPVRPSCGVAQSTPCSGDVRQANTSQAGALAANVNGTEQTISQGSGRAHGIPIQAAGQIAGNEQSADAWAESVQIEPSNTNAGVGMLSPSHGGSVDQSNSSTALSGAINLNGLSQAVTQSRGSGFGREPYDRKTPEVEEWRAAPKPAPMPSGVSQSNDSTALSLAVNLNETKQTIGQDQKHGGSIPIQAAGQVAGNEQSASSNASSFQLGAANTNGGSGLPHGKPDRCQRYCKPDHKPDPCKDGWKRDPCKPDHKPDPCKHEVKSDWCKPDHKPDPCKDTRKRDRCKPDYKPDPCEVRECRPDPCKSCRVKPAPERCLHKPSPCRPKVDECKRPYTVKEVEPLTQ